MYDAREAEIMKIAGSDERWENWLQFTQSRLVPKFTEVRLIVMPSISLDLFMIIAVMTDIHSYHG